MASDDTLSRSTTVGIDAGPRRDPASFALRAGTLIGRYVVVDQLGTGGMGTVYVAYDAQLARRVAIKVLRAGTRGEEAHARLLREAQAMARLTHPNVLVVHDVGSFGDGVFVATEYVEGQTLRAWLVQSRGWRDVLAVMKSAGRGLEAAHAGGIVHRDFKPANVYLGNDERVIVGDFGIARALAVAPESERSLPEPTEASPGADVRAQPPADLASGPSLDTQITETGALVGTIGYMSPEQALEGHDDARSDQFSFCVTLYRALYQQPPFAYSGLSSYFAALQAPPLPPPAESRVPSWIHAVVLRGLSREPSARFASMTELLRELDRDPTRRRRGWMIAATGVGLAALGALAWVQHQRSLRAECRAGEALIAATWGPEARAKVGAAITATAVPLASDNAARTQAALDAYAAEWARVHRDASEATLLRSEESPTTMRDRLACLDGEREALAALVDVLSRADEVVAKHAIGATYALASPHTCLEGSAARAASRAAETPERGARVTALRRGVAEAEAHRMTGKFDEALRAANEALALARAIPHRQSEAELLLLVAACKRELDGDAVAREALVEAFAACEAAGNDSLAAVAAAGISMELSDSLADIPEATRWLAIAKGVRSREGRDDRADAEILEAELSLLANEGHADRSLAQHDRLIELLRRIYGDSHPRIAVAMANYAGDLNTMAQYDLSADESRKAIAMQEHLFGPDVPMLSIYYNNLGSTLTEARRFAEARVAIDHALALVAPLGATNPHNILPLLSLAQLDNLVGDPDAALAATERGIAIVDAGAEREARFLPVLLLARGTAQLAKREAAAAYASCARGVALQDKQGVLGPDKIQPQGENALTCAGESALALGRVEEAIATLERSVSMTRRAEPTELSLAKFALARALTAAKRDPDRARALAEAAQKELGAAPGMEREATKAKEWLASSARR